MPMHLENKAFVIRGVGKEKEGEKKKETCERHCPLHTHLQGFAKRGDLGNVY